jgi:NAD(P)-dependent dehydrogenase (short-subunit alcohol dehydrogenase family)
VFAGDVTLRETCRAMARQCVQEFGALDLAFNNAGGHGLPAPIDQVDEAEEDQYLTLNLNAVYWGLKYQVAHMRQAGRGVIVNNASIFGLKAMGGLTYYTAAKFGVVGLTKAVALECADAGIRVNAVAPGGTETPNFLRIMGDSHAMDESIPMRRIGQPGEVADAVVWLMSDQASYVTGTVLSVDGGLSAG